MDILSKILTVDALKPRLNQARRSGRKIVFTNGCFDILHAGHVSYLASARAEADLLVVGLNSDESVRVIKGARRPIVPQAQRAMVLAGLGFVDYVVIFDEPDPLQLVQSLEPSVLIKGEDWTEENIIGGDFVKSRGGQVVRIKFTDEVSTSEIIERIVERYGDNQALE